jgi:hypothetical protein
MIIIFVNFDKFSAKSGDYLENLFADQKHSFPTELTNSPGDTVETSPSYIGACGIEPGFDLVGSLFHDFNH